VEENPPKGFRPGRKGPPERKKGASGIGPKPSGRLPRYLHTSYGTGAGGTIWFKSAAPSKSMWIERLSKVLGKITVDHGKELLN